MKSLLKDIRYGCRTLLKSPGFTAVAVLTLALGIGANSTVFSWVNSTLLNPIPGVRHTSDLASLTRAGSDFSQITFSYPDYVDLHDQNTSFSGLTAFSLMYPMSITGLGKPERVWGVLVAANYFDVLGLRPVRGRGFVPVEEDKPGAAPVAVISYSLWQTHFGGDKSVIARKININQHPYTIVGVAPPLFQGTQTGMRADLWVPYVMEQQIMPGPDLVHERSDNYCFLLGRLKPEVSTQKAREELDVMLARLFQLYPDAHKTLIHAATVEPLWRASYGANRYFYILLPMLMAIAGLVLLLACANVANLLLVRSLARRREMAIRLSIGAGRWRLVRQLLVESLLLSLAGGAAAMLFTAWSAGALVSFRPATSVPIALDFRPDWTVLLATLAIAVLTAAIFGILPALRSSRISPVGVLKDDGGIASAGIHKTRLSSGLVVAQISLSLLLLVCAGLFIRSFRNAQRFDPGFNADHVLLSSFDLFASGYSQADGLEFERLLLAKIEAAPGVRSVTLASRAPFDLTFDYRGIKPEGYAVQPHESMEAGDAIVGPNYLRTMQIPLLAGRDFSPGDTDKSEPVVIVNQTLADRYWPHQDAIGKRLGAEGRSLTVIGVAGNSSFNELRETPQPFVYLAAWQHYLPSVIAHARVSGDPLAFASTLAKTVHELNADLPVFDVATLTMRVQSASTTERMGGTFVGAFGVLALVLAAVGIYGVIAYTTRQRTREIGIRMSLGAQRVQVLRLVLKQGLKLTLIGLALGFALSLTLTRFLSGLLFGVAATDALTFACVTALLCTVALTACYIPAHRATRVDPIVLLRY